MTEAFPLAWPPGWPRTPEGERRRNSAFKVGADKARRELKKELRMLGASNIVISSDQPVRADGMPFAARRIIRDPGVAVYYELDGQPLVMARDRFERMEDNLRSIGLAVAAIRAVERNGGRTMMRRAFQGFAALPAPKSHWETLGLKPGASRDEVQRAWRAKAATAHPDREGGSEAAMSEVNAARDAALREAT